MESRSARIGWLGTGRMGIVMARRLVDAGHDLTVWNRTRARAEALAGATVADAVTDLATLDVVFITVSTPSDLEQVLLGTDGLLSGTGRPGVVVDCSTVDATTSARVRAALKESKVGFLTASVSGNPHVVRDGEAMIAASGPCETYERLRPLLGTIAKDSVWAGADEEARLVKIAHNLYLGMMVQALAEVTTLAEKAGVPRDAFLHFLNNTVLACDWVRRRTPDMLAEHVPTTFTTELLRKDFDLGLATARAEEVPMPLGALTMQLIQAAIGHGYRHQDFLALLETQATSAGLETRWRQQPEPEMES